VADAQSICDVLAHHQDRKPNFDVMPILSSERAVTRVVVREAIDRLFSGTDEELSVLYFSGHGAITPTAGGCVVTQDAGRYDEGIAM
jgi:hypothetical protein